MRTQKVLMLVNNDWKIDSRVRREATALASAGHEVHVIFRAGNVLDATEHSEGVAYHSVPLTSPLPPRRQLLRLVRLHAGVAFAGWRAPGARQIWLRAAGLLAGSVAGTVLGLMLLLVLWPLLLAAVLGVFALHLVRPNSAIRERARALAIRSVVSPVWRWVDSLHSREYLSYMNNFGIDAKDMGVRLAPDVVHSHDLHTMSTGYAISRKLGVPLVYDAHELETHTNYWSLHPLTKQWVAVYENVLIRRVRAVVTVCDSIADWLKEQYDIERPTVVLNSPDLLAPGAQPKETIRDRLALAADTPLAVYVGSVTLDRGSTHCVEAVALVPGLHFAFVGPRYIVTEKEILDAAERLGVQDRIHLVDPVPSKEVTSFVSTADCSVIAIQNVCLSYYFCFPNKLLESVISGVPVAVARLVELERFVGKFPVGVTMDEKDPASIAAAIREILADPARYRPGPEVLDRIRSEYGWPTQQAKLRGLYERILGGGPAAPAALSAAASGTSA